MSVRRIPIPWDSQPQESDGIEWDNPLSNALVFDVEFSQLANGRELVRSYAAANTVGAPTRTMSADMVGASFSSAVLGYGDLDLITGAKMTIEVIFAPTTTAQTAAIIQKRGTFSSGNSWALWIDTGSSMLWLEIGNATGTASDVKYGIALSNLSTTSQHLIATLDGTAAAAGKIQFYRNGLQISPTANTDTAISGIFNSSTQIEIGRVNNSTLYYSGSVFSARIYNDWINEARAKRHYEARLGGLIKPRFLAAPVAMAGSGTTLAPGVGHLALTGYAPTIARTANQTVAPAVGHVLATGYAPTVTRTASQAVAPSAGHLAATGYQPTVTRTANQSVSPAVGHGTLTGYAPTVARTANQTVSPGVGHAIATGYQPSIAQGGNRTVSPSTGHAAATGYAPTVTRGGSQVVQPAGGHVSVTGHIPVVAQTTNRIVAPGVGHLVTTGYAPTVQQSAGKVVSPGAGHLAATGYAPTIARTGNQTVSPATGHAHYAGYAPAITQGGQNFPKGPALLIPQDPRRLLIAADPRRLYIYPD